MIRWLESIVLIGFCAFGVVNSIRDTRSHYHTKGCNHDPDIEQAIAAQQIQMHHKYSRVHHHNPTQHQQQTPDTIVTYPVYQSFQSSPQIHDHDRQGRYFVEEPMQEVDTNELQESYTDCPPLATGLYPYAMSCRQFLNCWNGRSQLQSCAPGTVFNPQTRECDHPDKVNCHSARYISNVDPTEQLYNQPKPQRQYDEHLIIDDVTKAVLCQDYVVGLQAHPFHCNMYLSCNNGVTHLMECGPGTVFNPLYGVCDWPYNVDCTGRRDTELEIPYDEEESTIEEAMVRPFENPSSYVNSWSGVKQPHRPQQPIYLNDGRTTTPRSPIYVGSNRHPNSRQFSEEPPEYSDPNAHRHKVEIEFQNQPNFQIVINSGLNGRVTCPPSASGYYPNPRNCSEYVYCHSGYGRMEKCAGNTKFNPETKTCSRTYTGCTDIPVEVPRPVYVRTENNHQPRPTEESVVYFSRDESPFNPTPNTPHHIPYQSEEDPLHKVPLYYRNRLPTTDKVQTTTPSSSFEDQQFAQQWNPISSTRDMKASRDEVDTWIPTTTTTETSIDQISNADLQQALALLMRPYARTTDATNNLTESLAEKMKNMGGIGQKTDVSANNHYVPTEQQSLSGNTEWDDENYVPSSGEEQVIFNSNEKYNLTSENEKFRRHHHHGRRFWHGRHGHRHGPHHHHGPGHHNHTHHHGPPPYGGGKNYTDEEGRDVEGNSEEEGNSSSFSHGGNRSWHHHRHWHHNHPPGSPDLHGAHSHHGFHGPHSRGFHNRQYVPTTTPTPPQPTPLEPFSGFRLRPTTPMTTVTESTPPCEFDCENGRCVPYSKLCNGLNECGNGRDESSCDHINYEVRLANEHNAKHYGRVEVKVYNKWGYVCDDGFGMLDANVLCRELGFPLGASEVKGSAYYAPNVNSVYDTNKTTFIMDDVDCHGGENSLKDCKFGGWGIHNCDASEIVGVVCKVPVMMCPAGTWLCDTSKECIPMQFLCDDTKDCADESDESPVYCNAALEYRLVGPSASEGRAEIKRFGVWGAICDDDITAKEVGVLCRSLGFAGEGEMIKGNSSSDTGMIWLDQVSCVGNETAVDQCMHFNWGEHNCNQEEDLHVKCLDDPVSNFDVRGSVNERKPRITNFGQINHDQLESPMNRNHLEDNYEQNVECGRISNEFFNEEPDSFEFKVVKANAAKKGHHPWQATLRVKNNNGKSVHWCGAVLISKNHILTAAHCLTGFNKAAYFVRLGDYHSEVVEDHEVEIFIENWYVHEDFRKVKHMNNDLAVVVLKSPVRFSRHIRPICLPESTTLYKVGRNCTISGWGSQLSGKSTPSLDLREATVPILSDSVCSEPQIYGNDITEGMFCAGFLDEGADACDGDSGGPLVCESNEVHTLYGIISWGRHCGNTNKPGVYVRISKYIDWIQEKMNLSK